MIDKVVYGGELMEIKRRLDQLLAKQEEVLTEYQELIEEIDMDNIINENIELKEEVEDYRDEIRVLQEELNQLRKENGDLKVSLGEQMINERIEILYASKRKKEIYFKDTVHKQLNQLTLLESLADDRLSKLRAVANKELNAEKEEFLKEIEELKTELAHRIEERKNSLKEDEEELLAGLTREYDQLRDEEVDEKILEKKKRYNDIEVKIGLNVVNKIGVILLLFGVATAMKYTYSTWFNEYMKGIAGFLLGATLIGAGEWLNRKGKNLFALGLAGGGIGILYFTVFSSYFILNIVSLFISILVAILITALSLVLSQRYKSMTICGISLIGGYLPFFTYVFMGGLTVTQVYIAMAYLLILNILVLLISLEQKWIYINYLSFILNIPCLVYLSFRVESELIAIIYSIIVFVMYLLITLSYPLRKKKNLKLADIILLGINTATNCLLVFGLFKEAGYDSILGVLALVYALIYFGLGYYMQKSLSLEKKVQALFYITALTFSILMIPFQFGFEWAALGWLIEALILLTYGVRYKEKKMEFGAWVIFILCLATFYLLDLISFWHISFFKLKYTLMTLGSIYVLSLYLKSFNDDHLFKYSLKGKLLSCYKYFTIITSWFFAIRMADTLYNDYVAIQAGRYLDFYNIILILTVTISFSYLLSKIKVIQDKIVEIMIIFFYLLADICGFILNFIDYGQGASFEYKVLAIVILLFYNIFIFLNLKQLLFRLIKAGRFSLEGYLMSLAIYLLATPIILITNQFNLANINLIISLFILILSFIYIIYGFKKAYISIRRLGLALAIISTGKLFIFDLNFLDTTGRVIAYFCFGLVLIGISFIYQKLSNSFEEVEGR